MTAVGGDVVFRTLRSFFALALTCAAMRAAGAQQPTNGPEGQSSLVYADSTSFWINVPHGWVLDAESGRRDGLLAVLYRQGESWSTAEPGIYATVITPKSGFNAAVPAAIRSDSAQWAGQVPDLLFTVRDSIRTAGGAFAHLRAFRSTKSRQYATVAYMQADARVWMLTLTARSLASHDAAYADFVLLVKSYASGPIRQQ